MCRRQVQSQSGSTPLKCEDGGGVGGRKGRGKVPRGYTVNTPPLHLPCLLPWLVKGNNFLLCTFQYVLAFTGTASNIYITVKITLKNEYSFRGYFFFSGLFLKFYIPFFVFDPFYFIYTKPIFVSFCVNSY
jgi:hypothetical protein